MCASERSTTSKEPPEASRRVDQRDGCYQRQPAEDSPKGQQQCCRPLSGFGSAEWRLTSRLVGRPAEQNQIGSDWRAAIAKGPEESQLVAAAAAANLIARDPIRWQ